MLKREQYDERYFDGNSCDYQCSAGYGEYRDRGFSEQADWLVSNFSLFNKKVLDVGCAKGFFVEHLRLLGVDAHGCDWSEYALGQASVTVEPYLYLWDAKEIDGQWDYIISSRFLICFEANQVSKVVKVFNSHAKKQIHFIDLTPNEKYYLARPLAWWAKRPFKKGTVLIGDSWNNRITV